MGLSAKWEAGLPKWEAPLPARWMKAIISLSLVPPTSKKQTNTKIMTIKDQITAAASLYSDPLLLKALAEIDAVEPAERLDAITKLASTRALRLRGVKLPQGSSVTLRTQPLDKPKPKPKSRTVTVCIGIDLGLVSITIKCWKVTITIE
jgi:hypothetical protein